MCNVQVSVFFKEKKISAISAIYHSKISTYPSLLCYWFHWVFGVYKMVKSGASVLQSKVLARFSRYSDIQQDVVQFLFETTLLILFDIYCQTLPCKTIQLVSRYVKSRNIFVSNRTCYSLRYGRRYLLLSKVPIFNLFRIYAFHCRQRYQKYNYLNI